jgi:hypothetical protein
MSRMSILYGRYCTAGTLSLNNSKREQQLGGETGLSRLRAKEMPGTRCI